MTQDQVHAIAERISTLLSSSLNLTKTELETVLTRVVCISRRNRYTSNQLLYTEEWRPVLRKGYEQYEVSNWGHVRHSSKSQPVRPGFAGDYPRVAFKIRGSNNTKQNMVHELVAEAFLLEYEIPKTNGCKEASLTINHIDGDKWNPAAENLEVVSQSENLVHAYKNGLRLVRKSYGI
jgi:hypothetical protein